MDLQVTPRDRHVNGLALAVEFPLRKSFRDSDGSIRPAESIGRKRSDWRSALNSYDTMCPETQNWTLPLVSL